MSTTTPTTTRPSLADQAYVHCLAEALLREAKQRGLVVTITRTPLQPLAMGHEADTVAVYPDKEHR